MGTITTANGKQIIKILEAEGWVLARVDAYVKAHGLTRSGFLVQAAERAIR
ncbi:type II toxin-antitoxin system HicB family antitoxin [Verminephrobacter aporrectodeae]|uniref:type II toxin-antitoxin system HicB family antitoxin n=1 Tax=Verminephrobacter aporrectodeae TaxID=1110389 RepID=UPI002238C829|nr:type II toxin-antitoxin system HicB family antitoxin [Verminephrobacter aporrectodeae]